MTGSRWSRGRHLILCFCVWDIFWVIPRDRMRLFNELVTFVSRLGVRVSVEVRIRIRVWGRLVLGLYFTGEDLEHICPDVLHSIRVRVRVRVRAKIRVWVKIRIWVKIRVWARVEAVVGV